MRTLALTAVIAFVIDQLSKYLVVFVMGLEQRTFIEVLPPVLNFRMGWNTGINFGLFSGDVNLMRWVLVGLAVALSLLLIFWARRSFVRKEEFFAAGLIIGGALGNAIDRVNHGAVADFLNMSCCGVVNPYTFNIADIFIFFGAGALIFMPTGKKST